jgi:hypothetical protein
MTRGKVAGMSESATSEPRFFATLLHGAGVFQGQRVEVLGDTREELLRAANAYCVGSRYVASITAVENGDARDIYRESEGWLI